MALIKLQDNKLLLKPTKKPIYSIGDEAFGGRIAYIYQPNDIEYEEGRIKGFVVSDIIDGEYEWGCDGVSLGSTSLRNGYQNTLTIVNNCSDINTAAYICYNYSQSGYTDWYLPAEFQMNKIYLNQNLLAPSTDNYWTSTEIDSNYARTCSMIFYFYATDNFKNQLNKILAIRDFNISGDYINDYLLGSEGFGGKISYIYKPGDLGYDENKIKGLVIDINNTGQTYWGCGGTFMGAINTELGTGYQNTLAIVNNCSDINTAAYKCYSLTTGGYTDWFLPSIDEIDKIQSYSNILNDAITGSIGTFIKWSSTEPINFYDYAFVKRSFGNKSTSLKSDSHYYIPTRYFEVDKREIYLEE